MSSSFKFHSSVNESVPFNARYFFPTQSTKVQKQIVKLPPKNGSTFTSASPSVRIEFPSDGYLNPLNSVLAFDVAITETGASSALNGATGASGTAQAGAATTIQLTAGASATDNLFSGHYVRITGGKGAGQLRAITAYNGTTKTATVSADWEVLPDSTSTYAIVGGTRLEQGGAHNLIKRLRILYGSLVIEDIQEYRTLVRILTEVGIAQGHMNTSGGILDGLFDGHVQNSTIPSLGAGGIQEYGQQQAIESIAGTAYTKTYCLNLMSGLLTQKKLIPLKFMAAQLAIEITLASDAECLLTYPTATFSPTYTVTNVNYIAEMLEFDSTYDSSFLQGLSSGGVPIKFSSWHFFTFSPSGATTVAQIHERSRSVKYALAVFRDTSASLRQDSNRFYHATAETITAATGAVVNNGTGTVDEYQFRIGGRYMPAQPVRCSYGAAEAYSELLKMFNALGDYTRDSNITFRDYASIYGAGSGGKFIIGAEFENTDVMPDQIAGINAEEQSDLALTIKTSIAPVSKRLDVFVGYDSLLIVREGNVVDLVL